MSRVSEISVIKRPIAMRDGFVFTWLTLAPSMVCLFFSLHFMSSLALAGNCRCPYEVDSDLGENNCDGVERRAACKAKNCVNCLVPGLEGPVLKKSVPCDWAPDHPAPPPPQACPANPCPEIVPIYRGEEKIDELERIEEDPCPEQAYLPFSCSSYLCHYYNKEGDLVAMTNCGQINQEELIRDQYDIFSSIEEK